MKCREMMREKCERERNRPAHCDKSILPMMAVLGSETETERD